MNTTTVYLIGLALTVVINLSLFLLYLKKILLEQNGNKERPVSFWVTYFGIILFLGSLVFAMIIVPDTNVESTFFQISKQTKWSLIGTIISFFSSGVVHRDMVNGISGYDQVSGYSIRQIEDALIGQKTWVNWKNNIKNKYYNATENNLDNLFDY